VGGRVDTRSCAFQNKIKSGASVEKVCVCLGLLGLAWASKSSLTRCVCSEQLGRDRGWRSGGLAGWRGLIGLQGQGPGQEPGRLNLPPACCSTSPRPSVGGVSALLASEQQQWLALTKAMATTAAPSHTPGAHAHAHARSHTRTFKHTTPPLAVQRAQGPARRRVRAADQRAAAVAGPAQDDGHDHATHQVQALRRPRARARVQGRHVGEVRWRGGGGAREGRQCEHPHPHLRHPGQRVFAMPFHTHHVFQHKTTCFPLSHPASTGS
jgi:hypothetical protein